MTTMPSTKLIAAMFLAGTCGSCGGKPWTSESEGQDLVIGPAAVAERESAIPIDDRIAFLESRKAAAAKGATNELTKMEGIALDARPANRSLYVAMSRIYRTMSDNRGDVQLNENRCGVVYRLDLDATFDVSRMVPVVAGQRNIDPNDSVNVCSPTAIAEPDNLLSMADGRLIIGEDTDRHENNMMWLYSPEDGSLRRFATLPLGAEVTGPAITSGGDFFFNVQQPDASNRPPFDKATIGVVRGLNIHALPRDFAEVSPPATRQEKEIVRLARGEYQILGRSEDTLGGKLPQGLGFFINRTGAPMRKGNNIVTHSNKPDFNGFVATRYDAAAGWLYTGWEDFPGAVSRLAIRKASASWLVEQAMLVDFSEVRGTARNCFGSVSPWGTPLSSEEVDYPDTADWNNPFFEDRFEPENLHAHLGYYPNPYDYGYIVEIRSPAEDEPEPVKRLALGRFAHEIAMVMPDEKTVYLSDDATPGVFFKFVADRPGDLSSGRLYAAKLRQDRDGQGNLIRDPAQAGFDLQWIYLAHGSDAQITAWIAEYDDMTPADFHCAADPDVADCPWYRAGGSYIQEAEIQAWARQN